MVPLGEIILRTFVILMPHAWIQIQASIFALYFLHKKGIGNLIMVVLIVIRIWEKPNVSSAVARIWGGNTNCLLPLLGYGGNPKLSSAIVKING